MENAILEGFIAIWSLRNSYIPILLFNEDYLKEEIGALSPFWKFLFFNKFTGRGNPDQNEDESCSR